jgi:hypothetical protein
MERTLFDYMCLTPDKAQAQVTRLAQHCRRLGGEFVLLWHNSYLLARWHREFYAHILKALIGDMV